jgi:hypothetical protein
MRGDVGGAMRSEARGSIAGRRSRFASAPLGSSWNGAGGGRRALSQTSDDKQSPPTPSWLAAARGESEAQFSNGSQIEFSLLQCHIRFD